MYTQTLAHIFLAYINHENAAGKANNVATNARLLQVAIKTAIICSHLVVMYMSI